MITSNQLLCFFGSCMNTACCMTILSLFNVIAYLLQSVSIV